jgi:hypothetical protein
LSPLEEESELLEERLLKIALSVNIIDDEKEA